MRRLQDAGKLVRRGRSGAGLLQERDEVRESLGAVRDAARGHSVSLLVNDHRVMMVICPVNPGIPHPLALASPDAHAQIPGAQQPYTAVLTARPSIRGSAQEGTEAGRSQINGRTVGCGKPSLSPS